MSDPLIDHLEKTFAEAYRKEIDQEENVWRSLPFFVAVLALQLAVVAQVREWLVGLTGGWLGAAVALLLAAAACTLAALWLLRASIRPAEFQYPAREPALLEYAEALRAAQPEAIGAEAASAAALRALKETLAEQYAGAADNNRQINQRRALQRTRAGGFTLASMLLMVALIALSVVHTLHERPRPIEAADADRVEAPGRAEPPRAGAGATDGGDPQGVLEQHRDGAPGGGAGR